MRKTWWLVASSAFDTGIVIASEHCAVRISASSLPLRVPPANARARALVQPHKSQLQRRWSGAATSQYHSTLRAMFQHMTHIGPIPAAQRAAGDTAGRLPSPSGRAAGHRERTHGRARTRCRAGRGGFSTTRSIVGGARCCSSNGARCKQSDRSSEYRTQCLQWPIASSVCTERSTLHFQRACLRKGEGCFHTKAEGRHRTSSKKIYVVH